MHAKLLKSAPVWAAFCLLSGCAFFNPQPDPEPAPAEAKAEPAPAPAPAPVVAQETAKEPSEDPDAALHIKKKILVLPFLDHSERGQEAIAKHVLEQVSSQLANLPDVTVVTAAELGDASLVPELGSYNWKRIYAITRMEGISGIVTGTVDTMENSQVGESDVGLFRTQQFTTDVRLTVDIHDVAARRRQLSRTETGQITEERTQILESTSTDSQEKERQLQAASRALKKILNNLANQISRLAWSGRIAKVELHRFYINGGRATGLAPGQLLRVFTEAEPVYDSASGRALGIPPGRLKGMLRVVENFGPDASIAIVHSGAGIREGDRVEPFNPPASDR